MPTSWTKQPITTLSQSAQDQAAARLLKLAKPLGSFGVLEDVLVRLAGMQNTPVPSIDTARIIIFSADHGIARNPLVHGDAPYSQISTRQRVETILSGRGSVSIMARHLGLEMEVVDTGVYDDPGAMPGLISHRAGKGTGDIRMESAMDQEQLTIAMAAGKEAVERAGQGGVQMIVGGEIAVGKSISAAAIASALLGVPPHAIIESNEGLSSDKNPLKTKLVEEALRFHRPHIHQPLHALRRLGGFESAALCGAFIACGQKGIPVIIDGFASAAAALVAVSTHPPLRDWLFFGHRSSESGQMSSTLIRAISGHPVLSSDMHLGEGTGATAALSLLRMACVMNRDLAFAEEMAS